LLSEKQANKKWNKYVNKHHDHIMKIPGNEMEVLNRFKVDNFDYASGKTLIKENFKMSKQDKLYIFWSIGYAVETTYSIFLKFWDAFCHPAVDYMVLISEKEKVKYFYVEESFLELRWD